MYGEGGGRGLRWKRCGGGPGVGSCAGLEGVGAGCMGGRAVLGAAGDGGTLSKLEDDVSSDRLSSSGESGPNCEGRCSEGTGFAWEEGPREQTSIATVSSPEPLSLAMSPSTTCIMVSTVGAVSNSSNISSESELGRKMMLCCAQRGEGRK